MPTHFDFQEVGKQVKKSLQYVLTMEIEKAKTEVIAAADEHDGCFFSRPGDEGRV